MRFCGLRKWGRWRVQECFSWDIGFAAGRRSSKQFDAPPYGGGGVQLHTSGDWTRACTWGVRGFRGAGEGEGLRKRCFNSE